jgi:hypothetical protein
MEIIFQHYGQSLLIIIWIICGIVGFIKDPEVLILPSIATLIWFISKHV